MNLLFGSCAVKHWYPEFRIPNDIDIICEDNEFWIPAFEYLKNNSHSKYVDPDFLYTIKVSHAAWNIWWDKTIMDIVFLKNKGCKLDRNFYDLLISDWKIKHGSKSIKMNISNDEFFTNKITRDYDHDYLHEKLAFFDRPLHEWIRLDLSKPMCSETLFNQMTYKEQLLCALEEVQVIASERWVIPKKYPLKHAKYRALEQMIVSTTSGWFNLFLIENFNQLMKWEIETWHLKLQKI